MNASSEIFTTPIKVAVHRRGDNPIFGECATHVSVDDEAAGPFIVLESNAGHESGLRIDPDELEAVVVAARQLIAGLSMNAEAHGRAVARTVQPLVGSSDKEA